MDQDDDLDLFRREVGDVQPLRSPDRAELKAASTDTPGQIYRRRLAAEQALSNPQLSTDFAEPLDPEDILSFKRDGVQNGVFRKLRLGEYPVDARLDLHRMGVEQARNEVLRFVQDCASYDVRTALICHGKGRRSETFPVIKSFLAKWLSAIPEVIAFHSARNFHGGTGSVYVLFRKSRRQKDLNRRRYSGSR